MFHQLMKSVKDLCEDLLDCMNVFNCENELVTYTYDSCIIMAGQHNGMEKLVKDKYPSAFFIHCYAKQIKLDTKAIFEVCK